MAEYESCLPDEMLFRKGVRGPRTHHAHVMESAARAWQDYILVRDYLRRHAEISRAYGNVKSGFALLFEDDVAGYRNAKRPFVERIKAKPAPKSVDKLTHPDSCSGWTRGRRTPNCQCPIAVSQSAQAACGVRVCSSMTRFSRARAFPRATPAGACRLSGALVVKPSMAHTAAASLFAPDSYHSARREMHDDLGIQTHQRADRSACR